MGKYNMHNCEYLLHNFTKLCLLKVSFFISNPLYCFKCQIYGHRMSICRGSFFADVDQNPAITVNTVKMVKDVLIVKSIMLHVHFHPHWIRVKEIPALWLLKNFLSLKVANIVTLGSRQWVPYPFPIEFPYSNLLKQQTKSVSHISTQT